MMTISYEYEGALYVNLTNRCDCACIFCLRHNGHKGSIYADDLWLEHEPTRQEALDNLLARDFSQYRELVFCGFGEPMYESLFFNKEEISSSPLTFSTILNDVSL